MKFFSSVLQAEDAAVNACCFNPDFTINIESFGGLLLERGGTPVWELDSLHAVFLRALQLSGSAQNALEIARELWNDNRFVPDFETLRSLGALTNRFAGHTSTIAMRTEVRDTIKKEILSAESRTGLKAPTTLTLYPDFRCQQNCRFCFLSDSVKYGRESQVPEKWMELIGQAKTIGVSSISVLGGEPTLYPGLDKLIRAAQDNNINIGITSNGLHMPKHLHDLVHGNKNSQFCFSLESMDSTFHKHITGHGNERVLETIRSFGEAGTSFNVNTVGLKQSDDDLLRIAEFCTENGASVWFINLFYWQRTRPDAFPDLEWYIRIDDMLHQYIGKGFERRLRYQMFGCQLYWTYSGSRLLQGPGNTNYNRMITGCAAGVNQLEILPDGTALPCIQMDHGEFCCGNVFESGLEEVWNSAPVLKKLRDPSDVPRICQLCSWLSVCNGGCKSRRQHSRNEFDIDFDPRCPNIEYFSEMSRLPPSWRGIPGERERVEKFYDQKEETCI